MFIENGDSPLLNQETQTQPENDSVAPSLSRIRNNNGETPHVNNTLQSEEEATGVAHEPEDSIKTEESSKTNKNEWMNPENALQFRQEMRELLNHDWTNELAALGLQGENLENAKTLMQEFSGGIYDVITDQLERYLVPQNYQIPKVSIENTAQPSYFPKIHHIAMSESILKDWSAHSPNTEVRTISSEGATQFKGLTSEWFSQVGGEEAKHSVDSVAGKIKEYISAEDNVDSTEYNAQTHEINALGSQVLLARKWNQTSLASTRDLLQRVTKFRGEKREKEGMRREDKNIG